MSPNVKGFHGHMELRNGCGEISEEACLTIYFNISQFYLTVSTLIFPLRRPTNSPKASQDYTLGKALENRGPQKGFEQWQETGL